MKPTFAAWLIALLLLSPVAAAQDAPYVDSKAAKDRFSEVTAADMEALRGKRILFASRSFGLNLHNGLRALAKEDKTYELLSSYERYDVFKAGGDLSVIPADALAKKNFVHFLATYWPHTKRMEEMDTLLRKPPHEFGNQVDIVIVFFHTARPENFESYANQMDQWVKDFPKTRFIYVTAGFMGPKYEEKENKLAHEWSEKVRERYKGKQPLYDLGKILSDDFRAGHKYAPEYSKDPAEVHPSSNEGQIMMAKGMLLLLADTLKWKGGQAPAAAGSATSVKPPAAESLPADHPEMVSVQSILDHNGLKQKKAAGVAVVEKGHVTKLYLQEGGITTITDAIAGLPELRVLHCYGDRNLKLPLLKHLTPAIAECTKLEELLLTSNELTELPDSITQLKNLKNLSVADNKLKNLPPAVKEWVAKHDPKGLADQKP
jgi:hypothetical protein